MTARTAEPVHAWRDPDPELAAEPGITLPAVELTDDPVGLVGDLYAAGARRIALPGPVDLGQRPGGAAVRALVVVREATSRAIVVDWRLRPGPREDLVPLLAHLHPPAELLGAPDAADRLADWRARHYLGKCVHRKGPGFVEVRDRRAGQLDRFVIDEPEYLAAIDDLVAGAPADAVPVEVLTALVGEGLAAVLDDRAVWLPYRLRRHPWPAMAV